MVSPKLGTLLEKEHAHHKVHCVFVMITYNRLTSTPERVSETWSGCYQCVISMTVGL